MIWILSFGFCMLVAGLAFGFILGAAAQKGSF